MAKKDKPVTEQNFDTRYETEPTEEEKNAPSAEAIATRLDILAGELSAPELVEIAAAIRKFH